MAPGRAAFRGGSGAGLLEAVLQNPPPAAVRLNADVPADLEHIIAKALEKDRELRYQTASELRADLRRVARDSNATVLASQQAAKLETSRPPVGSAGRTGWIVAGGIGIILALVGAFILGSRTDAPALTEQDWV